MTDNTHTARAFGRRSVKGVEADILAELRSHLELATRDNVDAGMDPEDARRAAEERFGDFGHVFTACRTEKLKDWIMLQRFLFALVLVLTVGVVVQAYQLHQGQRETEDAIRSMQADVHAMTRRIEDRFDAALFLGERTGPRSGRGTVPLEAHRRPVESSPESPAETRQGSLGALVPDGDLREALLEHGADDVGLKVGELASVVRDRSQNAAARFEAVHALGRLATSTSGHEETPLRPGDRVLVEDPLHAELCFEGEVNEVGNLKVPELGFVSVAGRTRGEVELLLQRKYDVYFAEVDLQVSKETWAFGALIDALEDPDVFVRIAATKALHETEDLRARRALLQVAAHDPEAAVRDAAEQAVERYR